MRSGTPARRRPRRPALLALSLALALAAPTATPAQAAFQLQLLPDRQREESAAWFDVDGNGRKDFVSETQRRLDVYLLDAQQRLGATPAWRVQAPAPWNLWEFADVRPDLPGDELLLLAPDGLGVLSFHRRGDPTGIERLIQDDLPVHADAENIQRGRYALDLDKDRVVELLLPSRRGIRIYKRTGAEWRPIEEISSPLRPTPRFAAHASHSFLVGFGRWPMFYGTRRMDPVRPGRLTWPQFEFRSTWRSSPGQLLDWNGDGRLDLIDGSQGRPRGGLRLFLQAADGRFDLEHPVVPRWPSRAEEIKEEEEERRQRPPDLGRDFDLGMLRQESLADVNGDGRLDLVRLATVDTWAAPKTRVAVYLQTPQGGFPDRPDSVVRLGAVVPSEGLPLVDIDGDGDLDLLVLRIDLQIASLSSHMKDFFRGGLEANLGAYPWQRDGHARRPAWEKGIVIGSELFDFAREPSPFMQIDRDVTGDGRPDLLLRTGRRTVAVYAYANARTGYAAEPLVTLTAPFALELVEGRDVDGDGRLDLYVAGRDPDADGNQPIMRRAVFFQTPDPKRR